MSETASTPPALNVPDPTLTEVPAHLWLRSGRPLVGTATRVYIALVLIATALIFVPRGPVYWGLIAGGVLAYFLFPLVIQGLLAPLERRVLAARRRDANGLLQEVRTRRLVRQFAPHAWLTLQEGRLHLRRGDGKAAARAFAETVRLSRGADEPGLVSAQAQALLVAEQPEQARELLQAQAKKRALPAIDRLHLGLALLGGKGHGREALEHVQAAAAELGPHPRVLAALALALHRADEATAALETLQRAQDALGSEPDPFDEALVQRGVKLLRTVQKALQKRERKQEAPVARVAGGAVATPAARPNVTATPTSVEPKNKSPRRAKKDERRAARRASKAEKRTLGVEPVKAAKKVKAAKVEPVKPAVKPVEAKPVEAKSAVKPVEAKVETSAVKPVEAKVETSAVKPVEAKVEATPAAKPIEATAAVKPVEAKAETPAVKPIEAKVEATAAVKPIEAKVETPTVKPIEAKVETTAAVKPIEAKVEATPAPKPIEAKVETPAVKPVEAQPSAPVPAARPVVPVSAPVLRPAPPAGASLFGSLGSTPGPRPVSAPVPVGAGGAPVLPPVPKASSLSGPIHAPRPPVIASTPIVRPAAVVPVTPAPRVASAPVSLPKPPVAPTLPPARPAVAVVMPGTPIGSAPLPAAPQVPVADLSQALPDTDDGWDDMLDALEADGPSSPA